MTQTIKTACSAEDMGSIPGLGRSSREGNGNPLQYFCLENPMDGPWGHKRDGDNNLKCDTVDKKKLNYYAIHLKQAWYYKSAVLQFKK